MKNKMIKQAEENAINQAKYCQDVMQIIDALQNFTNRYMDYGDREKALTSLHEYRQAVYSELNERLARCFMFAGVGGKKAKEFSLEQFQNHFKDDTYCVMQFLEANGQHPSHWYSKDEEQFKKEAQEKISELSKKEGK